MFDDRELTLLRAFSDLVQLEIEALYEYYKAARLNEQALQVALAERGAVTTEDWNNALAKARAGFAVNRATSESTPDRAAQRQRAIEILRPYRRLANEPDAAFLQPIVSLLATMRNLPEEGKD